MTKPTNQDLLERIVRLEEEVAAMEQSLRSEIGSYGKIVLDLNRRQIEHDAVEAYKQGKTKREQTRLITEILKQLLPIISIIGAILYAYASSRGLQ